MLKLQQATVLIIVIINSIYIHKLFTYYTYHLKLKLQKIILHKIQLVRNDYN